MSDVCTAPGPKLVVIVHRRPLYCRPFEWYTNPMRSTQRCVTSIYAVFVRTVFGFGCPRHDVTSRKVPNGREYPKCLEKKKERKKIKAKHCGVITLTDRSVCRSVGVSVDRTACCLLVCLCVCLPRLLCAACGRMKVGTVDVELFI